VQGHPHQATHHDHHVGCYALLESDARTYLRILHQETSKCKAAHAQLSAMIITLWNMHYQSQLSASVKELPTDVFGVMSPHLASPSSTYRR
jgi:hypothetical protein